MGRAPCCDKANVKKGPWSPEEDAKLKDYIEKHGTGGNWIALPQKVGLKRCGKSCRLRWLNYLRPNIKHGEFSEAEDRIICTLFATIGSRWSIIASQLQGRTDNDIKNYWNTKLKKKMMASMNPPSSQSSSSPSSLRDNSNYYYPQGSNFNASASGYSYSYSSSILSGNSSANSAASANSNFQLSQEGFMNSGMFVFGGEATATVTTTATSCCSSSDGSCNNQMSSSGHHVMEAAEYGDGAYVNCLYGGGIEDTEKQSGILWEENPLDYGIQDIKHLIGTTSTSTISCSNNFLFDEIKAEERVMY